MKAHIAVAHFALDLGPGHQCRHRVHHNDVDSAGAHQRLRNFQSLLAGVRLGNEHIVNIHAQRPGIGGVQRVLGVHKGNLAALFLGLRRHMEGKGRLTRGLRPVDLHNAPSRQSAHAQRHIQRQ